jgi:hypothetical protein
LRTVLRITVHPNLLNPAALAAVDTIIAVGQTPAEMLGEYAAALGRSAPSCPSTPLEPGEALVWERSARTEPFRLQVAPGKTERRRHSRKYAEGELPPDRSFYFRGPEGKLNLRAQNLLLFLQLAAGLDDETWTYHLRQGDYSRWFREAIKDDELAEAAGRVEEVSGITPEESRHLIREAVEQKYTAPAPQPLPVPGTDAEPKA